MEKPNRGMATEQTNFNEEEEWNEETRRALLEIEEEERKQKQTAASQVKTPAKKQEAYREIRALQSQIRAPTTQILNDPELVKFFKGRENDPLHFFYTPEGNLETRGAKDIPNSVIFLEKKFVSLKEPEYVDLMKKRLEELKKREEVFDAAIQNLRRTLQQYKVGEVSAELVVQANTSVLEASEKRSLVAYPERWVNDLENPVSQDILIMYEPYEKRKLGYNVMLLKHNELSRKDAFGSYVERSQEEEEQEGGAIRIRFITDVEDKQTGHFHPFTLRNFKFNETEYSSPYQAFEGERFKQLGKEDLRKQILGTRSGRTIHAIAVKDKTMVSAPQQLWEDILVQFFYQHPDFRKELDATGTDKFHIMDKEVPAEYGMALDRARLKLRELGENELDHQEVKEKVITEEEQKKAKVGAIIHNFKRKY